MKEKWSGIPEFPNYSVSNYGSVRNAETGKLMRESLTKSGLVKVGLVSGGVQYTRSVCILVAHSFVHGYSDTFNTPIHLDGNQRNNRADNLAWRPRWFAWKYSRQFEFTKFHKRGPILDVKKGVWYDTVLDAAVTNGLLIEEIMKSVSFRKECLPTRQIFSFY